MSEKSQSNEPAHNRISRRSMLHIAAKIGAAGAAAMTIPSCDAINKRTQRAATRGRINQSITYWCFEKYWDIEKTCQIASRLGCKSVELVEPKHCLPSRSTASSAPSSPATDLTKE